MKYLCTYCNVFAYDDEKGDLNAILEPDTTFDNISDTWMPSVWNAQNIPQTDK
ncbi:MAG: rubredoxin [Methanobacteriaceae archaeon]|nr:rubredoxin [Methanobacteriaceae archaeon]